MNKATVLGLMIVLPFLAGCVHTPKSVSDWHDNLITKDDAGLCVASIDDTGRDAENRKNAALEIIKERKIKCSLIKKAVQKRLTFEQDYKKVECQKAQDDMNKKVAVGTVAVAAIAILAAAARSSPSSNDTLGVLNFEWFEMMDPDHDGNWTVNIPAVNFTSHASGLSNFTFFITAEEENNDTALPMILNVELDRKSVV